jgi:hypothetical protein
MRIKKVKRIPLDVPKMVLYPPEVIYGMMNVINAQSEAINGLIDELERLKNKGRGTKNDKDKAVDTSDVQ